MNIRTVADNLRNTIAGKEALLANYSEREEFGVYPKTLEYKGICDMLVINVAELKRILKDVEQLQPNWTPSNCPYAEAETCHRMD